MFFETVLDVLFLAQLTEAQHLNKVCLIQANLVNQVSCNLSPVRCL